MTNHEEGLKRGASLELNKSDTRDVGELHKPL